VTDMSVHWELWEIVERGLWKRVISLYGSSVRGTWRRVFYWGPLRLGRTALGAGISLYGGSVGQPGGGSSTGTLTYG
jgi:hypothetical protein